MQLVIDNIVSNWEMEESRYQKLGRRLLPMLKNFVNDLELYPEISYRVKDLLSIIRKLKKKNRSSNYSYSDLRDKLGVRIICTFVDDMDIIDRFIMSNFIVIKSDKKKDTLDPNRLDYISNHYDLSIDKNNRRFKRLTEFQDLIFEIQVRTLNQHAWSNTSHALSYKQEANLSPLHKRKVFRLLSLYEIADDEFSIVNNFLRNSPDNIVYNLLRKTEGKIYKFAKVDFDREMSLKVLNILTTYFESDQLQELIKEIDAFIIANEKKIRKIFKDNAHRFYEIPFLVQPEIFVIWYALDRFPFSITDNWNNDFSEDELEQIQTLWGKDI